MNEVTEGIGKSPSKITKTDLIYYIIREGIRHVNFMYPAADGRLKTLNFVIHDYGYLNEILTCGERVDGSSLFPNVEASSSDLYVVPRYRTAFQDPFSVFPTLTLLCDYLDKDGDPFESSPIFILRKACEVFHDVTGMDFEVMGELEFYVIGEREINEDAAQQRCGYHESAPFATYSDFRQRCLDTIASVGGCIKYGHNEVGKFSMHGKTYEQHEIEFLPVPAVEAVEQLMLAKWIIRNLAHREGVEVTFAPKITSGRAGSGLHIHMRLMRNGNNQMLNEKGEISDVTKRAIAGMMKLAPSLTAFGNTIPTSYFRLVPKQEAPTNVCWGVRNRSALVRVPLGWTGRRILEKLAAVNPCERVTRSSVHVSQKQTVEIRSADGSANLYHLVAGLAVACRVGFELDDALQIAAETYVNVDIHNQQNESVLAKLGSLPDSCAASADCLEKQRHFYEAHGVFSTVAVDGTLSMLRGFNDRTLRKAIEHKTDEVLALVQKHLHCG